MAVTYRASAIAAASAGTGDRSCTFTPASGDLLIVLAALSVNSNDSPTCDDDNSDAGTYSLIDSFPTATNRMCAFVRESRMSNTNSTIVTVGSGSNTSGVVAVIALTGGGLSGAAAIRQFGLGADTTTEPPVPAFSAACLTGNCTIAAIAATAVAGTPAVTPPTNWTERQESSATDPIITLEVATRDSGFTGTTVTFGDVTGTVPRFVSIVIEIATDITGTLAVTLDAATLAGTGTVDVAGTAAVTLGAATLAATGTVDVQGTSAVTLGALTAAGTGTVAVAGTTAISLDATTLAATGTVDVAAVAAITLDDLTPFATATVDVLGSLSTTLDDALVSADGTVAYPEITGSADVTLDAVTAAGVGVVDVVGTTDATLADVTVAGTATADVTGTSSLALDDTTLSAEGTADVQGALSATLDDATTAATATVDIAGAADVALDDTTSAAVGTVDVAGSADVALDDVTAAAEGVVGDPPIVGTADVTLDDAAVAATGSVEVTGVADVTLGDVGCSGSGTVEDAAAPSAPSPDLSADAREESRGRSLSRPRAQVPWGYLLGEITGRANIALDDCTSTGTGSVEVGGALSSTLDDCLCRGAGGVVVSGVAVVVLDDTTIRIETRTTWPALDDAIASLAAAATTPAELRNLERIRRAAYERAGRGGE